MMVQIRDFARRGVRCNTPLPVPSQRARLLNISTRANAKTGDNIPIAGFIITGTTPKKVLVRVLPGRFPERKAARAIT